MKKIVAFLMVAILLLCLTGCNFLETETTDIQQTLRQDIEIWTDEETGVQYIIYRSGGYGGVGGITPRYNADGTLYTVNNAE
jgi:hypothetical protein